MPQWSLDLAKIVTVSGGTSSSTHMLLLFEAELPYAAPTGLELTMETRLASNLWKASCLCFLGPWTTGIHHHSPLCSYMHILSFLCVSICVCRVMCMHMELRGGCHTSVCDRCIGNCELSSVGASTELRFPEQEVSALNC